MPHSVYFAPEAASNLPCGDDFLFSRDTDSEKGKIKRARFSSGTRSLSFDGENAGMEYLCFDGSFLRP